MKLKGPVGLRTPALPPHSLKTQSHQRQAASALSTSSPSPTSQLLACHSDSRWRAAQQLGPPQLKIPHLRGVIPPAVTNNQGTASAAFAMLAQGAGPPLPLTTMRAPWTMYRPAAQYNVLPV